MTTPDAASDLDLHCFYICPTKRMLGLYGLKVDFDVRVSFKRVKSHMATSFSSMVLDSIPATIKTLKRQEKNASENVVC